MRRPRRYHIKPDVMVKMLASRTNFDMAAIEAMHLVGDSRTDINIYRWLEDEVGSFGPYTEHIPREGVSTDPETGFMLIATQNGVIEAEPGDWIIRDPRGIFSKCSQNIFESTYDLI
jgi:hypothetical protein